MPSQCDILLGPVVHIRSENKTSTIPDLGQTVMEPSLSNPLCVVRLIVNESIDHRTDCFEFLVGNMRQNVGNRQEDRMGKLLSLAWEYGVEGLIWNISEPVTELSHQIPTLRCGNPHLGSEYYVGGRAASMVLRSCENIERYPIDAKMRSIAMKSLGNTTLDRDPRASLRIRNISADIDALHGGIGGDLGSLGGFLCLREGAAGLPQRQKYKVDAEHTDNDLHRGAPEHGPSSTAHRLLCFQAAALYLIAGIFLSCFGVNRLNRIDDLRHERRLAGWRLTCLIALWGGFTVGSIGLGAAGVVAWHPDSTFFILRDDQMRTSNPHGSYEK